MADFDCANCGSPLPAAIAKLGKNCPRCGNDPTKHVAELLPVKPEPPAFVMDSGPPAFSRQVVQHHVVHRTKDDPDTKLLKVSAILLIWMVIILLAPCFIGLVIAINAGF